MEITAAALQQAIRFRHSDCSFRCFFCVSRLCECDYLIRRLSQKVGREIYADPMGRYAGALGAALIARDGKKLA